MAARRISMSTRESSATLAKAEELTCPKHQDAASNVEAGVSSSATTASGKNVQSVMAVVAK